MTRRARVGSLTPRQSNRRAAPKRSRASRGRRDHERRLNRVGDVVAVPRRQHRRNAGKRQATAGDTGKRQATPGGGCRGARGGGWRARGRRRPRWGTSLLELRRGRRPRRGSLPSSSSPFCLFVVRREHGSRARDDPARLASHGRGATAVARRFPRKAAGARRERTATARSISVPARWRARVAFDDFWGVRFHSFRTSRTAAS